MSSSARIKVMISGLPGKMAMAFAEAAQKDKRLQLINHAFTGETTKECFFDINGQPISLIKPSEREIEDHIFPRIPGFRETIFVDFTEPEAIKGNIDFYLRHGLLGTTGGDRKILEEYFEEADISAVVAPNMAIPIVVLWKR